MQAGFSLMEAGLVRSKNATNILMKSTLDACKFRLLLKFLTIGSRQIDVFTNVEFHSSYRCNGVLASRLRLRVWRRERVHRLDWVRPAGHIS